MDPAIAAAIAAVAVATVNMVGSVLHAWIKAKYGRNDLCRDAVVAAISIKPPESSK